MTVLVPMTVEKDEDGWWCAHAQLGPNVGANGQGRTRREALDDLREAVVASFEADGHVPEWLVRSDLLAVDVDEVA
jgi:predicted RNase H-like HicB family nuclease